MPYELERPHDLRRATSPCWRPTSNLGWDSPCTLFSWWSSNILGSPCSRWHPMGGPTWLGFLIYSWSLEWAYPGQRNSPGFTPLRAIRTTKVSTTLVRGQQRGCRPSQRSMKALVARRSLTFSPQRLRSRAPSVEHVSSLLGFPSNYYTLNDLKLLTFRIWFVLQHPRLRLEELSRERCQLISDLPEIEHRWSRLSSEGHLRKVNLLSTKAVELIDAPLKMGMITMVSGVLISTIFVFELILSSCVFLRYVKL